MRPNHLCILFLLALFPAVATGEERPPNLVVILTDDQGWGDLSLHGNTNLSTPHIDSLARDGAQFDRFFVCPVCSPTRAEFLTGRYHTRSGVYSTSAGGERMNLDEKTIADLFRAAGYATGAFGKWHNGMQYPYHPLGRGFDEFYGFCSGHWGEYFDSPLLEHNGRIVGGEGYIVDDFTDRAIDYIAMHADRPFFVYLPYNTPHSPMQVPDEYWNRFKDRELEMRHREPGKEDDLHLRAALAMCENIDWNVGRLLTALEQRGLAENTIVVFFHDNGPNGSRWNGDMEGRKGSTDEGGVRSPLLVRWPARIAPGTVVKSHGAAIDLLPTLADLAGVPVEGTKPIDGISLKPALLGNEDAVPDRAIVSAWKNRVSLRTPRFRLDYRGRLFDIIEDPGQRRDISGQFPEIHSELKTQLEAWKSEHLPGLSAETDPRPFVIGHPGFPYTQIPARDAEPNGEITRSNRFPNDSYFDNWVNVGDSIRWEVEVAEAGKFEVTIYATCAPEDSGSIIELRFGEASLTGEVTLKHNPPLQGADRDRSPRAESYTKDFRPMELGIIELPAGSGTLELRALEKRGREVLDFRLMMLTRLE